MLPRLLSSDLSAQTVIPDSLAAKHVGETVTVEGVVHEVHDARRRGIVYLLQDEKYPAITVLDPAHIKPID